ncbi:hypothetical protein THAOC_06285, partial [Thalassiosira oceanica]
EDDLRLGPLLGGGDARGTDDEASPGRVTSEGAPPGHRRGGFREVACAMEEWQVRNVWDEDGGEGGRRRDELEEELAGYLVESFGRYIPQPEEVS